MSTPTSMRAYVQHADGSGSAKLALDSVPVPQPASDELLVKISHVGQNPTDVQSLDSNAFGDGSIFGCDFVGTVKQKGDKVTTVSKGDVIAGLVWGGEKKGLGAYCEYSLAVENISFKVPYSIPAAEAATVPLAATTAWLALFSKACLSIDRQEGMGRSVLIWGGSSSVGLYAIQIAALHKLKVFTTCSPKHFDRAKAFGASAAFDYKQADVVASIKSAAPDLQYVFDTIGDSSSSTLASQAIRDQGGNLCTVRPGKANTSEVTKRTKVTDVLVWTAFLSDHRYGEFFWPADKDDHDLASELFRSLPTWLENGTIKPSVPKILRGLEAVPEGFQEHRDGKISGYKIVYELEG
ncbi:GroES-like protein [Pyrenochaeta sp. DS3sAY3a]|nr:GroES-like protein [Pyrenochaeta sp. DS3sAY3a]